MNTPDLVTVFNFSQFERGSDVPVVSPYKAPRDIIEKTLKRNVLEGTGEQVPRDALDSESRYRRIATGWGELPSQ
jgi:hypothetical protein